MRCTGCESNGTCTLQMKGSIAINECPCGDCLIKGICKSPCEAMHEHYEDSSMMPNKPNIYKVKVIKKRSQS